MSDIQLASTERCQITATGLVIAEDASEDELIMIGRQLATAERSLMWWVGDLAATAARRYGETYDVVMEATSLDYGTVRNAASIARKFELSRRRDNLSWSHHAEVASLEPDYADQALEEAEKQGWSQKDFRAWLKDAKRAALPSYQAAEPGVLPAGPFQVIYADPPWAYEDRPLDNHRSPSAHYPTMATERIAALPIAGRADATGAVLYLWATAPCLPQALEVMRAWGFSYKSQLIWDKERPGLGYWSRNRHELLLIGTCGIVPPPHEGLRIESIVQIKRSSKHSEKPAQFTRIIESYHPNAARKLELFARGTARAGWDAWGNEAEVEDA